MPKPSEFFVGVLDFFAILLPGAIATAILAPRTESFVFRSLIAPPTDNLEKWMIFIVFAYFLGHLIFLTGSYIDRIYNILRERFNSYGNESAYWCATRVRDALINDREKQALNTFQWSRAVLIAKCPAAAEDIHRLEADSKFFRSLLIVCAIGSIAFLADHRVMEGIVTAALTVPCFARYYERRLKSTTQAYIHIITLHRLDMLTTASHQKLAD